MGWIRCLLLCFLTNSLCAEDYVYAPALEQATAVNQLDLSRNACGPAALINSYRFGSKHWQKLETKLKGKNSRDQMLFLINAYGTRVSNHMKSQIRWNRNKGISSEDLTDIANEIRLGTMVPKVKNEAQFLSDKETHKDLLARTHKRLKKSLATGFPPLMAIQRQAQRTLFNSGDAIWMNIQSHFITIVSVPKRLDENAQSFTIEYIDPWRARRLEATISIPDKKFGLDRGDIVKYNAQGSSPSLIIDCPYTSVGRKLLKKDEPSVVIVGTISGAF